MPDAADPDAPADSMPDAAERVGARRDGSTPSTGPRRSRRLRRRAFLTLLVLLLTSAFAAWWLLSTSVPERPTLSGTTTRHHEQVGGRTRTWIEYRPAHVDAGRAPVAVLHGSMQDADGIRALSGYEWEHLADTHGFVVLYPDGIDGNWNECRRGGDFTAKRENVDDVAFLRHVIASARAGRKAIVTGYSSGGQMALRMAIEAPGVTAAAAPVAASTPTTENMECTVPQHFSVPLQFINGTDDPFNPYAGGEVSYHGIGSRGTVLDASRSAAFWAERTGDGRPVEHQTSHSGAVTVWRSGSDAAPVERIAVAGGGHQYFSEPARGMRLLGATPAGVSAPRLTWAFVTSLGTSR